MWQETEIVQKIKSGEITVKWGLNPKVILGQPIPDNVRIGLSAWWEKAKTLMAGSHGYFFGIECSNGNARLLLLHNDQDGIQTLGCMETVPEEVLLEECGTSGQRPYLSPIGQKTTKWLHDLILGRPKR